MLEERTDTSHGELKVPPARLAMTKMRLKEL